MKNFGCSVNFFCCENKNEISQNSIENKGISLPTPASGTVIFGRYSNGENIKRYMLIYKNQIVASENSQLYNVIKDENNLFWSASYESYIIPPGMTYVELPVQASAYTNMQGISLGPNGNCGAFAINEKNSSYNYPIPGCDFFYNPKPFANGSYGNSPRNLLMRM